MQERKSGTVSIVIPVYKVEAELPRCVGSILKQTYRDLEIILVDDGSPDSSGSLCDAFAAQDSRVKVIHKENGGASSARNAGLDAAAGAYIAFIDADDTAEPELIERLITNARQTGADVTICGYDQITEIGRLVRVPAIWPPRKPGDAIDGHALVRELLQHRVSWTPYCKLYAESMLNAVRFDPGQKRANDMLFSYFAAKQAERVCFIDDYLYKYVRRPGNLSDWSAREKGFVDFRLRALSIVADDAKATRAASVNSVIWLGLGFWNEYRHSREHEVREGLAKGILDYLWRSFGWRVLATPPLIALDLVRKRVLRAVLRKDKANGIK